jgi:hypothetical protein
MKTLKSNIIMCIVASAICIGCTSTVNAQDPRGTGYENNEFPRIEFGVRFMPTISAFQMQTSEGGSVKGQAILGFGAGALLGYNFNRHIELQLEVIYSSISRKYTENEVERKINMRYVNIPLLFSLNTNKFGAVNLNIVVGPQVGIRVGSTVYTSGGDGTSVTHASLEVKKSDLGFAYGLGLDFGLNKAHTFRLGIGFRGVTGLIDISNNSVSETTDSYYIIGRTNMQTYAGYTGISFLF